MLICEEASDGVLVHHIQRFLIQHGATKAEGITFHSGTALTNKVREGLEGLSVLPDLLFVHRDADHRRNTSVASAEKRYAEIKDAVQSVNYGNPYVGIFPVYMTEAKENLGNGERMYHNEGSNLGAP
ncbi:hypothetical protein [Candidatus Synechococcus spongiarum]|uniref:hypothetical protein n=1 Tax=Candidatus Synechococcus spongiarum TaxID=431041 RepID=UPI001178397D|nr:hypothetical protein [Candidatus Synechococcus spongiarum]